MEYKKRVEQIAETYHLAGSLPDMFIENAIQRYEVDWISKNIQPSHKVLELGVGDGITMSYLAQICKYEVVEGSAKLARRARETLRNLGFGGEVHEAWFEEFRPDGKYDLIYASHVLEHVEDPATLLDRMKTWLTEEGEIIVVVPNAESIHRRLGKALGMQPNLDTLSTRDHHVGHLRVYSLDSLERDVASAGLRIEKVRGFFLKSLSNAQMVNLTEDVIYGLCKISDDLDPRVCANLCMFLRSS